MNWEALGAIGEIVGAVAVIVTLGYLALQIRQNTRSIRASTFQSVSQSWMNWLSSAAHGDVSPVIYKGSFDPAARERLDEVIAATPRMDEVWPSVWAAQPIDDHQTNESRKPAG